MALRILLLACLGASACIPLPVLADTERVFMWLAEGATNRVYILGSVHLLREEDHPLPAALDAAYEDAEALVMELDMDDLDPVALQALTTELGVLRDERTLAGLLGERRYAEAEAAARELRIPLDLLAKTEPWFAAITVEQLMLMRLGFNPAFGVEMHMATRAAQDGKPVEGLETVAEQLGFLDNLPLEAQADLLLQTLAESRDVMASMDELIAAWRRGDAQALERYMLAEFEPHAELYEAIVARRNRAWVDDIVALLDDTDDYLLIVGALHLVGEDGVPALLEQRGIETRQMHATF